MPLTGEPQIGKRWAVIGNRREDEAVIKQVRLVQEDQVETRRVACVQSIGWFSHSLYKVISDAKVHCVFPSSSGRLAGKPVRVFCVEITQNAVVEL